MACRSLNLKFVKSAKIDSASGFVHGSTSEETRQRTYISLLNSVSHIRLFLALSSNIPSSMELYFIRHDSEKSTLVSPNGIAHYQVFTKKGQPFGKPATTLIQRCADPGVNEAIAEIEWKRWSHPVVRSNIFDGQNQELEVREFLYKIGGSFSSKRYFLGNDNEEYRWMDVKESGLMLCNRRTLEEVARFKLEVVKDGVFHGDKKWILRIQPTDLDIDLIVLSFIIILKRNPGASGKELPTYHDEEMTEGGCGEVSVAL